VGKMHRFQRRGVAERYGERGGAKRILSSSSSLPPQSKSVESLFEDSLRPSIFALSLSRSKWLKTEAEVGLLVAVIGLTSRVCQPFSLSSFSSDFRHSADEYCTYPPRKSPLVPSPSRVGTSLLRPPSWRVLPNRTTASPRPPTFSAGRTAPSSSLLRASKLSAMEYLVSFSKTTPASPST
jgi:hypothetical protein